MRPSGFLTASLVSQVTSRTTSTRTSAIAYGYTRLNMDNFAPENVLRYFHPWGGTSPTRWGRSHVEPEERDVSGHGNASTVTPPVEASATPIAQPSVIHAQAQPTSSRPESEDLTEAVARDRRLVSSPPAYPSPPRYAPLPKQTETSLLLAPPPRYTTAEESPVYAEYDHSDIDTVVVALVLLNIIIWSIVIVAYASEWMLPGPSDEPFPEWQPNAGDGVGSGHWMFKADNCSDGTAASGYTRVCAAGRCFWGWVDCTEALGVKLVD